MSVAIQTQGALAVSGIDHVVIRVRDLDAAERLFDELGFSLTPRGFHKGRGSANHTTPFRNGTYVELIQLPPGDTSTPFTGREEGPVAVALRPQDSWDLYRQLADRGYEVAEPRDLARAVDLPGGAQEARFINVALPDIGPQGLRLFACQHLTRELVWREQWLDHANGVTGVQRAILVVADPGALADAYRRLFGAAAVALSDAGLSVRLGAQRLDFLSPAAFAAEFPGLSEPDAGQGAFLGLTFSVASLDGAADRLNRAGIAFQPLGPGRLVVPPGATGGTLLEINAGI